MRIKNRGGRRRERGERERGGSEEKYDIFINSHIILQFPLFYLISPTQFPSFFASSLPKLHILS
jgi:hypothetical protein